MVDISLAKEDPTKVFKCPRDVLRDASISREDKIDILRRWAYDEREMSVAEEENMASTCDDDSNNTLDEILECLLELGADSDQTHPAPTKQG